MRAKAGIAMVLLVVAAIFFSIFMDDKVKAKFMGSEVSGEETSPGSD
jgi:hypothetical protein